MSFFITSLRKDKMPIVEQRDAIDGYITEGNFVALSQRSYELGKKVAIYIHPDDVDSVCEALQGLKAEAIAEREHQAKLDDEAIQEELNNP